MNFKIASTIAALGLFSFSGCCDDDDDVYKVVGGMSAADFQVQTDYLNHPTVEKIFHYMPRYEGSSPPNLDGRFISTGSIQKSTTPNHPKGDTVTSEFCFGPPAGGALEVAVLSTDPNVTLADAGAFSFIEGAGDFFTVYTAFISIQGGPEYGTCEVHQVVVYSGRKLSDGSLAELWIGFAIVGAVGDCGKLNVDNYQVSLNTASRTGDSCVGGSTPSDPSKVFVSVENFLVEDAVIFVNGVQLGLVPLLSSATFEASPGFTLAFDTVPPLNAGAAAMGLTLSGTFSADTQPAGRSSRYAISNQIGKNVYFAPMVSNHSSKTVTAIVNSGIVGVEFDCGCNLLPDKLGQYLLGYHEYWTDRVSPLTANIRILTIVDPIAEIVFNAISDPPLPTPGLDSGVTSVVVAD